MLQFSALCQRTVGSTGILECLLSLLAANLPQRPDPPTRSLLLDPTPLADQSPGYDTHLVQWLTLLLAHILSSVLSEENDRTTSPSKCLNIFTPVYSQFIRSSESPGTPPDPPPPSKTPQKSRTPFRSLRHFRSKSDLSYQTFLLEKTESKKDDSSDSHEDETVPGAVEPESCDRGTSLSLLPPELVRGVCGGLMQLLVQQSLRNDWENVPAICKVITLLCIKV